MTVGADPVDTNTNTQVSLSSSNESITEKAEETNSDPWAANLVDLNLGKAKIVASNKVTTGPSLSSMMGSNTTTNTTTSSQPIMLNNSQPVMLNPTPLPPRPMMNAPPQQQPMGMAAFTNPYENMQFPPRPMMNAPPQQQPMGMAAFNNPYSSMNGPMPTTPQQPMGMAAFNSPPQQPMMGGGQGQGGMMMMGGGGQGQGSMMMMNQSARPPIASTMPAAIRPVDPFTNLNLPIKSSSSSSSVAPTAATSYTPYQSKPIQNSLDLLDLGLKK